MSPPRARTILRVAIVANKTWEVDPLVLALLHRTSRPAAITGATLDFHPDLPGERGKTEAQTGTRSSPLPERPRNSALPARPRARVRCELPQLTWAPLLDDAGDPIRGLDGKPRKSHRSTGLVEKVAAEVEVWCIEDWMTHRDVGVSSSSSYDKFNTSLPTIRDAMFAGASGPVDLVIAFGTAGIPTATTLNGSVALGSRVYIQDGFAVPPNDWTPDGKKAHIEAQKRRDAEAARAGPLLDLGASLDPANQPYLSPRLNSSFFRKLPDAARAAAEARFIAAPIHPASPPRILAGTGFASLGTINVSNYDDYIWADERTRHMFEEEERQHEIGSMETTHGLIRLTWEKTPFLYLSGLTDSHGAFNSEVTPRVYAQNLSSAHNAGIAAVHLIPELLALHLEGALLAT